MSQLLDRPPIPNQTTRIGTKAAFGTALKPVMSG